MTNRPALLLTATALVVLLAGCSGSPAPGSSARPGASSAPEDRTVQAQIDGEWIFTRTVTSSNDTTNPLLAAGTKSLRYVQFYDVSCSNGPCSGKVLTGPNVNTRAITTFTSAGNVITYDLDGFLNCVDPKTKRVLVENGFSYHSHAVLKPAATQNDSSGLRAITLSGTLTYTDTVTNAGLTNGCTRTPVSATSSYAIAAIRAEDAPISTSTPTPSPSH